MAGIPTRPRSQSRFLCIFAVPLFAWILCSLCSRASAEDLKTNRATLKGIKTISVFIDGIDDDAKTDGLTLEQLETDTELRLRKAGIKVVEMSEAIKRDDVGALHVQLGLVKDKGVYAVNVVVELAQDVTVDLNRAHTLAVTWSRDGLWTVGSSKMSLSVRMVVGDFVDQFLNAYLSVNPK